MKNRKSKSIEKRRILNIEVGLVTALSLLLVAFNWNSNTPAVENLGDMIEIPIDEEIIQSTIPEEIKKPELPKKKYIPDFEIVEDHVEQDSFDIISDVFPDEPIGDLTIKMKEEVEEVEVVPYVPFPQRPAEFIGGEEAFYRFLASNLKYPLRAKEMGISGKVFVQFKVDNKGRISEIEILRTPDPMLSEEAIRVVSMMPNWKPAEQGGRKVITTMRIPVNFKLK